MLRRDDIMTRPLWLVELVWGNAGNNWVILLHSSVCQRIQIKRSRTHVVTWPHGLEGRRTTRWARRHVGRQYWTRHSRRRGNGASTARTSLHRITSDTDTFFFAIFDGTKVNRRPGCRRFAILSLAE